MHYLILTIYTNPKNTKRIIFFICLSFLMTMQSYNAIQANLSNYNLNINKIRFLTFILI